MMLPGAICFLINGNKVEASREETGTAIPTKEPVLFA
jgi:hypothetical protein